jgi:hypothetical protein
LCPQPHRGAEAIPDADPIGVERDRAFKVYCFEKAADAASEEVMEGARAAGELHR